jgi:hypothetical protein
MAKRLIPVETVMAVAIAWCRASSVAFPYHYPELLVGRWQMARLGIPSSADAQKTLRRCLVFAQIVRLQQAQINRR